MVFGQMLHSTNDLNKITEYRKLIEDSTWLLKSFLGEPEKPEQTEETILKSDLAIIQKGIFSFGKKASAGPPRPGLVKKQIIDKTGRKQTKWVKPEDSGNTPIEKKRETAKQERKKITHLQHSEEDKKKIEEMTKRHKEFEEKAKQQRRDFGTGPKLPSPGMVMRVYAKGKVNIGGMLAQIEKIAEDGKTVIARLTSGAVHEFQLDHLEFAKSDLPQAVQK